MYDESLDNNNVPIPNFRNVFISFILFFCEMEDEFVKGRIDGADDGDMFSFGQYFEYYIPYEYELFNIFITAFIQENLISIPKFLTNNTFVDAIRSNVQRMYTFKNQGTDFNQLIVNYLNNLNGLKEINKKNTFIRKLYKLV